MTTTSLFGELREHELKMNMISIQENEDKHVRTIALKAVGNKNCQHSSDDSEEENLSFLSKKFSKFLKKKNNKNHTNVRYVGKKPTVFNTNKYTCFGCGEQGNIKAECPSKESKEKKSNKKFEKRGKSKKAYIVWDDNDVCGSSSEEEETNLYLTTKDENDRSNVSSCSFVNIENYSQLLEAFKETHEEAYRLTLLNNQLKGLNNWLENIVKALEEDLGNSKNDFENLELIDKNLLASVTIVFVKIVNLLKRRYLVKTMDKLSKGKSNF